MESKHQYFKIFIRTSKNFINPTKTCVNRHQVAQITFGFNGLFTNKFDVPLAKDLNKVTIDPFLKTFLSAVGDSSLIPTSIKVYVN